MENNAGIIWASIGLLLIASEIVTGTFILLFFGLSALLVALTAQLTDSLDTSQQIMEFALIGSVCLLAFRKKIKEIFNSKTANFNDQDNIIILSVDIPANGQARIEYQGTTFTAINEENTALAKGEKVLIVKTDGINLIIKKLR